MRAGVNHGRFAGTDRRERSRAPLLRQFLFRCLRPWNQSNARRPLSRLMTSTINPTTRRMWIRPPPICRLKPRSHKITRTRKIVQSIAISFHSPGKSHPVRARAISNGRDKRTANRPQTRTSVPAPDWRTADGPRKPYFLSFSLTSDLFSASPLATA